MSLIYKKQSLFEAKDSLLIHACNCLGVWGSGIAKVFKEKFPEEFKQYEKSCKLYYIFDIRGTALILQDDNDKDTVACLMTSKGYGKNVDPPESILRHTNQAIAALLKECNRKGITKLASNKFNSGLFNVPWEQTEAILLKKLEQYPEIEWVVFDPEL